MGCGGLNMKIGDSIMTLNAILNLSSAERNKIPLAELTKMLTPYFPAVRKPVLPPEKYSKQGLNNQLIESLMKNENVIRMIQEANKQKL